MSIERSSAPVADGKFRRLLVGGTTSDGAFVLAQRENGPEDFDATIASLTSEEQKVCSFGSAIWFDTVRQRTVFGSNEGQVDDRPGRVLAVEGKMGDTGGPLRIFDAACGELLEAPSIEVPAARQLGSKFRVEGYTARALDSSVLWVDPWSATTRSFGEGVSDYWRSLSTAFWLIEGGVLVLREPSGETLASVGSAVTEAASAPDGSEVAFVEKGGLFVMKTDDLTVTSVATEGVPCSLAYLWTSPLTLTYREDCALGSLALLDRTTNTKKVVSSAVTGVDSFSDTITNWLSFCRAPEGGERELWVVPEDGEPVLVGQNPDPKLCRMGWLPGHGLLLLLDSDGSTGTLGTFTLEGGFKPLLEKSGYPWMTGEYLTAVAEQEGNVGTLVALDEKTLKTVLRVPRVHSWTLRPSAQAEVLGYVRDWDDALGAGTFEVWIQPLDQRVVVDEGVSEFTEMLWPEPGVVYAVRTPGREGLWTAHVDF